MFLNDTNYWCHPDPSAELRTKDQPARRSLGEGWVSGSSQIIKIGY